MRWMRVAATAMVALVGCEPECVAPARPEPCPAGALDCLPDHCEGLDPDECLLPWPSSRFLVPDGAGGFRVELPAAAMPVNCEGVSVDPEAWNGWDGFSATTTMIAQLPGRVSVADLRTVVLAYDTVGGAVTPVEHFAEVEAATDADPDRTTIYLRPRAPFAPSVSVVVAIGDAHPDDGIDPARSGVFAALLDDRLPSTPAIDARRDAFESEVLAPLAGLADGIPRDQLVLAWSFRTASDASATRDLVAMRDAALAGSGLGCEIEEVREFAEGPVLAEVFGTFDVPLFLEPDVDAPRLVREGGVPVHSGRTVRARIYAIVPRSVAGRTDASVPLMEYGHGLFTHRFDVHEDFNQQLLENGMMIGIATDLLGLSTGEEEEVASQLHEVSQFSARIDRVLQSLVAMLVLPGVFRSACVNDPLLAPLGVAEMLEVGADARTFYSGNSQGAIIGPTIAALAPDIDRFALGVGGMSYPIMIPRSVHFAPLEASLAEGYPRRIDRDLLMVMFSHHWDRFEGAAFARLASSQPDARFLYQVGVDDSETPNVASEMAARALDLPFLESSMLTPTMPAVATDESAFVAYDYGVPAAAEGPTRPEHNCVHEWVRRDPRAQEQMLRFFLDGTVVDTCDPDEGCAPPEPALAQCAAPHSGEGCGCTAAGAGTQSRGLVAALGMLALVLVRGARRRLA